MAFIIWTSHQQEMKCTHNNSCTHTVKTTSTQHIRKMHTLLLRVNISSKSEPQRTHRTEQHLPYHLVIHHISTSLMSEQTRYQWPHTENYENQSRVGNSDHTEWWEKTNLKNQQKKNNQNTKNAHTDIKMCPTLLIIQRTPKYTNT